MLFRTAMVAAVAALFANSAMATPIDAREIGVSLIATDAVSACNCPNNCNYGQGHSCKFKSGPSTSAPTVDGTCNEEDGTLTCVANT